MSARRTAGVVGSVVAHAALFAFAFTRPPDLARPPPRPEAVRIELVTPRKPPPEAPEIKAKPVKQPRAPKPVARVATPAPVPPSPEPAPLVPATPTVETPVIPVVPVHPEPPPGPKPTKPVDLFHPVGLTPGGHGLAVPPPPNGTGRPSDFGMLPGEAAGETATNEADRVAARIGGTTLDANAKARVQMGLVDPEYTKLGRAFLGAWDPEKALPDTTVGLWMKRRAQNAVVGTQLWLQTASNYARTGTPMAEGETLDEAVRSDLRDATSVQAGSEELRKRETFRQYMKGKFDQGRSTLVLVEENVSGRVTVSLVKGSGDNDVDRGALEDIRIAVQRLHDETGAPPKTRHSMWSLRLQIIINPPLPIGGFTFDEVLESPKLELPLGRKLLKRIQLEAVYDDDPRLKP